MTDTTDYELMLKEFGFTQAQVDTIVHNTADQVGMPDNSLVELKPSAIHGKGLFVTQDVFAGTILVAARICGFRTPGGRYTNHVRNPNCLMVRKHSGDVDLVAKVDLVKGTEVTIDYRQSARIR